MNNRNPEFIWGIIKPVVVEVNSSVNITEDMKNGKNCTFSLIQKYIYIFFIYVK
jgi:hypothetical protein